MYVIYFILSEFSKDDNENGNVANNSGNSGE